MKSSEKTSLPLPAHRDLSRLPKYVPGKSEETVRRDYHLQEVIKLSSNENSLGTSPKAMEAIQEELARVHRYPDHESRRLRSKLSETLRLPMDHFLVSSGLEEMIACIGRAYLSPGDTGLMPEISFIKYPISGELMDCRTKKAAMKGYDIDLDSMLNCIEDSVKIIWLSNPNNPTGTYIPEEDLRYFLDAVPRHVLVVLDEAYGLFADAPDYPKQTEFWHQSYPNLLVMRSFSKSHGLAGLRVGFTIGLPELLQPILQVREIFSVTSLAEAAAAAAAEDTAFLKRYQELLWKEKGKLYSGLNEIMDRHPIDFTETQANFIYITVPYPVQEIFAAMQRMGVIIRPTGSNALRVTIGRPEENRAFLSSFSRVLDTVRTSLIAAESKETSNTMGEAIYE